MTDGALRVCRARAFAFFLNCSGHIRPQSLDGSSCLVPLKDGVPLYERDEAFVIVLFVFPKIKMRTIKSCRGKNLVGKGTDGDGRPSGASNLP
jgi:hypothetical protein